MADYSKSIPQYKQLSAGCKDLIDRLMTVDIYKRMTIDEALDHEWLIIDA